MEFVIWGSNLAGGFLRSRIEQNTEGSFEYNKTLIKLAEKLDINAVLFPIRYMGNIGGNGSAEEGQLDALTLAAALIAETENIHFIAAVLPGFIHPATLAKIGSTIDVISNGRFHINLVSGWFKKEQETFGIEWINHEDRYRRSTEYLEVLKGLWSQDNFSYEGDFYTIKNATLTPKPIQKPYPSIYQGGNSEDAQVMAGVHSDVYFMNGAPIVELQKQIENVNEIARRKGRTVKFAVNAFVIARKTSEEAFQEFQAIIDHADEEAILQFRNRKETLGMWKNATQLSDFVANNEGFRTGLIGSYDEVVTKLQELSSIGIEKVLITFKEPLKELPEFHKHISTKLNHSIFNP